MSIRTTIEHNRRNVKVSRRQVLEVLPDYFPSLYPNLVAFLQAYYDSFASDQQGIVDILRNRLFQLRDLEEVDLQYIDSIFYEIGNGAQAKYFTDPRLIGKLISQLVQNKGNEFSIEMFFRIFFDQAPEIRYPKNEMLYVFSGDSNDLQRSRIGAEDNRIVQDGAKWQILSVNIKSGISLTTWETLYRKFVHIGGFYLTGEVIIETVARTNNLVFSILNDTDSDQVLYLDPPTSLETDNLSVTSTWSEMHLETDSEGTVYVLSDRPMPSDIDLLYLDSAYPTLLELAQKSSFTMDKTTGIEMDNTLETTDEGKIITSYNADSA